MGKCTCGVEGFDHSATCPACTDNDPIVVIARVDDWEVMYVRGKKKSEGHSIALRDIADVLPQLEVRALHGTAFDEYLSEGNLAPDNLSEVPRGS